MNKADWATALAAVVGVLGIGFGLWWADSAAALVISLSILRDGIKNLRAAVGGLIDTRAKTYDDAGPDPLGERIDAYLRGLHWVDDARSRIRDEGHVYHIESFVVIKSRCTPKIEYFEEARNACIGMDSKVQDIVIIPVSELPEEFLPGVTSSGAE